MIFSIDTETTGLDAFNGDKPFGISYAFKGKTSYPSRYVTLEDEGMALVEDIFRQEEDSWKVFHNAKFDIIMLNAIGHKVRGTIHDTMIMAAIYNSDEPDVKLKGLAQRHLGENNDEEEELKHYMRKHKISTYDKIPHELMERYARKDAVITLKLFEFYRSKGVLEDPIYIKEMQLLECLVAMQQRGHLIDKGYCRGAAAKCAERIGELDDIIARDHKGVNINSTKQLAAYLFDDQGLRCDYLTEKGNPAFDSYHLSKYEHPIVPIIEELKELQKVKVTYFDSLIDRSDAEDVIHCDFFQVGARTGRFSCRTPNLQNIPRSGTYDVRKAFICRPGYSNYYIDYSQIELRVLAHYSQEPIMLEEYNKEDCDLHSRTCEAVFGEVTKEKRTLSKNINFGIIYGMGPKKFCEMVNRQYPDFDMTYTDARGFINKYYAAYQKVRTFTWRVPQKIMDVGYVKDIFGRHYTCGKNESYKGVNYLIQGCSAGIIKKAMIEIHTLLESKKSNILLTIHDELVIEIHDDEQDVLSQIVEIMEDRETFRVPILVNVEKTATDWSEKGPFLCTYQ